MIKFRWRWHSHPDTANAGKNVHWRIWAYDGTAKSLRAAATYNQITVQIADQRQLGGLELARLLALVKRPRWPTAGWQ